MLRTLLILCMGLCLSISAHADKLPRLVLAGPYAAVSNPLIHMVESGALADIADKVEFVSWRDPDQLRVLVLEEGNNVDVIAMPTNVAANLYNRGIKLKLLNVSAWGMLWMVSRDSNLKTLADFKGKEIAMPFRADMPDIVFSLLAREQGLDVKRDFKLRYVASPLNAMQLLITRRVDHALLAEPAISMALRKTHSFPVSLIAPELHRSVDLQQEWGRLFQREARIAQAGITLRGELADNTELGRKIAAAYAHSLQWCTDNASACGDMVARYIDLLTPEAVADSIAVSHLESISAVEARPELEFFFGHLLASTPAVVGGKMPDDNFYFTANAPLTTSQARK